jgi:hypothetical protein
MTLAGYVVGIGYSSRAVAQNAISISSGWMSILLLLLIEIKLLSRTATV